MIIIDGETFNVPIINIDGMSESLDKYAERDGTGRLHREMIGMFDNYDLFFGMSTNNPDEYARLYNKLTESVPWHTVVLPTVTGTRAIVGYFANTKHKVLKQKDGRTYWKGLSTSFVSRERRPT